MHIGVIGAGIIGISVAYHLADRGMEVTVFDKGRPGMGSTGRANGGIRAQFTSPINVALSQRSIEVWETFEDVFETDIAYRRPGYLFLARETTTARRFQENVETQRAFDVPSRYLDPADATDICPELSAEHFVGATYSPEDGFADPHLALQGYLAQATDLGVDICGKTAVTDIVTDGDGVVRAIETSHGTHAVDFAINAAGPWATQVARFIGQTIPVSPRRRALAVLEPEVAVPDSVPLTVDVDLDTHFRPERDGNVVAGGFFDETDPEQDPDRWSESVSLDWAATLIERLSTCADYFGEDTLYRRGWAGLYAVTPDHHPIIEEASPGFINVVGFSGHGFMHSPATGQVVADLVERGETSIVDLAKLDAGRFERGDRLTERTILD